MNIEEAQRTMQHIEDSCLLSLRRSLLLSAARYAEARVCWRLALLEERRDMDAGRTAAHNAFIDACNIMSRNMAK